MYVTCFLVVAAVSLFMVNVCGWAECIKERRRQLKGNSHPNNITFDFNDHSFLKNHKFENELKARRETIVTKVICWA